MAKQRPRRSQKRGSSSRRSSSGTAGAGLNASEDRSKWWWLLTVPIVIAVATWAVQYFGPGMSHFVSGQQGASPSAAQSKMEKYYKSCPELAPLVLCSEYYQPTGNMVTRRPVSIGQVPLCSIFNNREYARFSSWASRNTIAAGGTIIIDLLVKQDVILHALNFHVIREARQPGPSGERLYCNGPQGGSLYNISVNLAKNPPTTTYQCSPPCGNKAQLSINATKGDQVTIQVNISTSPSETDTWSGSIDLLVGTKEEVLSFGAYKTTGLAQNAPFYGCDDTCTAWQRFSG